MQFHRFLDALDMGQCQDQQQTEALLDIALMLIAVDGVVEDSEMSTFHQWLDEIQWNGNTDRHQHCDQSMAKCQAAVAENSVDDFLRHRAGQLIDAGIKQQAINLATRIANADGVLDDAEQKAIQCLQTALS